jgi:hypothetical protein|nr:MAG TPA: hypothetical protein [Caudoviricetes sp.]
MLIKIRNDRYVNPEKIDSLVVLERANGYDVFINMSYNGVYPASTGYKTFEEAEQAMEKLAEKINNTK